LGDHAQIVEVSLDHRHRRVRAIHRDETLGPTGKRFDPERPRSGKEIQYAQAVEVPETRKNRFPHTIRGGADTGRRWSESSSPKISCHDPQLGFPLNPDFRQRA
jgi:hypothetical protein